MRFLVTVLIVAAICIAPDLAVIIPAHVDLAHASIAAAVVPAVTNPYQVMSLAEWAKLNGFHISTAKRLIAAGDGPRIIQLSEHRVGVRHIDNQKWQEQRLRKKAS
jgi:predicted DNA-binding transcriptional regulator AlpA